MEKQYISYDTIKNDAIKMSYDIYQENFIPDIIYTCLRGGAYLGNIISECFKLFKVDKKILYAAVVARSYRDDMSQDESIKIEGWTYPPNYLDLNSKVLIVDDIYDSGLTINTLVNVMCSYGLKPENIKIAVHDYKIYEYKNNQFKIKPDFFCQKHSIKSPEENVWIHYLGHEILGLSYEEIEKHFDDPQVKKILKEIKEK